MIVSVMIQSSAKTYSIAYVTYDGKHFAATYYKSGATKFENEKEFRKLAKGKLRISKKRYEFIRE